MNLLELFESIEVGPVLVSIAVTPDPLSVNIGASVQLTATGTYDDDSTLNLTSAVTWASDDEEVATVSNGSTGGVLSGVAVGSANITATLGTVVGDKDASVVDPKKLIVGSLPIPNSNTTGAGMAVYARPYPIESDVDKITLKIGNHRGDLEVNDFDELTINIAVGKSNGSGGFDGTPTVFSAQTVPGDGTFLAIEDIDVERGSDGCILIAYSVPGGGADLCYASGIYYGTYKTGTETVYPLASPEGNDSSPPLHILVERQSAKRPFIVLGDSILGGAGTSSPFSIGFMRAAWNLIAGAHDVAVGVHTLPGGKLAQFADPDSYPALSDDISFTDMEVGIRLGVNSLTTGLSQMQSDLTDLVERVRTGGAAKVFAYTIPPQVSYGGVETVRTDFNTWLLENSLELDYVVDADAAERDPSDHSILLAANSDDGTHLSATGQEVDQETAEDALSI